MFKRLFNPYSTPVCQKQLYYINSNNILPAPLDEKTEMELLMKVREGDMEARNTLIVHNSASGRPYREKFESTRVNIEDLISIGSMGPDQGRKPSKSRKTSSLRLTRRAASKTRF